MKVAVALVFMASLIGCQRSKPAPAAEADNSATRYVESLQDDAARARTAVDKYNASARQEEAVGREASGQ